MHIRGPAKVCKRLQRGITGPEVAEEMPASIAFQKDENLMRLGKVRLLRRIDGDIHLAVAIKVADHDLIDRNRSVQILGTAVRESYRRDIQARKRGLKGV